MQKHLRNAWESLRGPCLEGKQTNKKHLNTVWEAQRRMHASQGRETVPVQGACSDGTTSLVNGSISHHVNDVKCQY